MICCTAKLEKITSMVNRAQSLLLIPLSSSTVFFSLSHTHIHSPLLALSSSSSAGGAGVDGIWGGVGGDYLYGGTQGDYIYGQAGKYNPICSL